MTVKSRKRSTAKRAIKVRPTTARKAVARSTRRVESATVAASSNGESAHAHAHAHEDLKEIELLGSNVLVGETWVDLEDLVVDNRYQRPVSEARASRYAVEWNQALAGLITVSCRPDNTYAILDGQHRARAAMIRRMTKVWCEVFFDLTPQQEAYIFRERNKQRVATSSLDDYRAAITAGDPQALRVQGVLDTLGVHVGNYGKQPDTYAAVAALMTLDNWGVLKETLTLIRTAWPSQARAKEKPVLLGVGMFVWNFKGQIDHDRWTRIMSVAPLLAWMGDARSLRASLGQRDWEHMARIVTHHYDSDRRGGFKKLGEENLRAPRKAGRSPST